MHLKFKNPPLSEVIVGLYFGAEVAPLRAEHVGVFWSTIRKDFPKIQQQPVLTIPPTTAVASGVFELAFPNELFPMPRYWLEGIDEAYLMQIQRDAFIFNWRKRGNDYPHFEAVKTSFDRNYTRYIDFLNGEFKVPQQIPIAVAELTYVNVIDACDYWKGASDTKNVLPAFGLVSGAEDPSQTSNVVFNQVLVEQYGPDLTMRTTVRSGFKGTSPVLTFELRCTGRQTDSAKSAVDQWYERAHTLIGKCFLKITNPEIQRAHWQYVE